MENSWLKLIEHSLRFEHCEGDVTTLPKGPYSTGWRQLPFTVCAQILDGCVNLQLQTRPEGHLRAGFQSDIGQVPGCMETHQVKNGQALIVPANVHHRIDKISTGVSISRWASFRANMLGNIDALEWWEIPPVFKGKESERMGEICAELAACKVGLNNLFRRKVLGFELVSIIAGGSTLRRDALSFFNVSQRLAPVFRAIQENPAHAFALKDLAKLVCLSPSRFHALFTKALGMPPMKYLQQQRMDQAKNLLLTADFSVSEIAGMVGFQDEFHFSRLFKKTCGLSPQHYRQQVRKNLWENAPKSHE